MSVPQGLLKIARQFIAGDEYRVFYIKEKAVLSADNPAFFVLEMRILKNP